MGSEALRSLTYAALLATLDDLVRLIRVEEDLSALRRLRRQQREVMREAIKRSRKEGSGDNSAESQGGQEGGQ